MKSLIIYCHFTNAEETIAKIFFENEEFKRCKVVKHLQPDAYILRRIKKGLVSEKFEVFGFDDDIDKVYEYFNMSDLDIDLELEWL